MTGWRERGTSAAPRRHVCGLLLFLFFFVLVFCSGYPFNIRPARRAAELFLKFVNHRMIRYDRNRAPRNHGLPDRGPSAPQADDPFVVFQKRDYSARTDFLFLG